MNTYTINNDKVKICLTDDEVISLFGGYEMIDYSCPESRKILDALLCRALPQSMLPLDCKRVLIEVNEELVGCSIQVTKIYEKGKRLHKIRTIHKYILLFNGSEDMILFASQMPDEIKLRLKDDVLYGINGNFALCFSSDLPSEKCILHFKEYGRILEGNLPIAAAVSEYGRLICRNPVKKLQAAFKN